MEKEIKQCDGKWNGYYIEASQEACDLLMADGYIDGCPATSPLIMGIKYNGFFIIKEECKVIWTHSDIRRFEKLKLLYIVDSKLSATKHQPNEVGFSVGMDRILDCDERDLPFDVGIKYGFVGVSIESKTKELFDECESIIGDRGNDYGEAKERELRLSGL